MYYRKIPDEGEIEVNCIIPVHSGKGYDKLQIQKVLRIFQSESTHITNFTTADNLFFIPAQRIYLSCRFKEAGRDFIREYAGLDLIHYEM